MLGYVHIHAILAYLSLALRLLWAHVPAKAEYKNMILLLHVRLILILSHTSSHSHPFHAITILPYNER